MVLRVRSSHNDSMTLQQPRAWEALVPFVASHLGLVCLGLAQAITLSRGIVRVAGVILGAAGEEKEFCPLTWKKKKRSACH